jgi:hypothetical protein
MTWLTHVKKTMKSHKGMKFGQVLKLAAKTYKKGKQSGGSDVQPHNDFGASADISNAGPNSGSIAAPAHDAAGVGGRRRRSRRGRKSRRGTRRG